MKQAVENIVMTKLGSKYANSIQEVDLAVKQAEQIILNYCDILVVPEALQYVWADIACDIVTGGMPSLAETLPGGVPAPVKSVVMGDMRIDYGVPAGRGPVAPAVSALVQTYQSQLNKFRAMKW